MVQENMYLVSGANAEEARHKAEALGRSAVAPDETLTIDGVPAEQTYLGLRKLVNVSNPWPMDQAGDQPVDGTELTYATYLIQDTADAAQLAAGQEVDVRYVE